MSSFSANPERAVCHLGPLPPPLGGISTYLYRLRRLHPEWTFIDEGRLSKRGLVALVTGRRGRIVYHSPNFNRQMFIGLLAPLFGNEVAYVIHGDGLEERYKAGSWLTRAFIRLIMRRACHLQAVSPKIVRFLEASAGIPTQRITLEHAFLPPPVDEEAAIVATYPEEVRRFITEHSPLIVANGSSITFYHGTDLYGLDMCVDMMAKLRQEYPRIGLLFALAEVGAPDYLACIQAQIHELGLGPQFYFMTGQRELWPLFRHADLMVRPTATDGFGTSVAEALHLGTPAVASDVCERYPGTLLFRSRDSQDFLAKVRSALRQRHREGVDPSTSSR